MPVSERARACPPRPSAPPEAAITDRLRRPRTTPVRRGAGASPGCRRGEAPRTRRSRPEPDDTVRGAGRYRRLRSTVIRPLPRAPIRNRAGGVRPRPRPPGRPPCRRLHSPVERRPPGPRSPFSRAPDRSRCVSGGCFRCPRPGADAFRPAPDPNSAMREVDRRPTSTPGNRSGKTGPPTSVTHRRAGRSALSGIPLPGRLPGNGICASPAGHSLSAGPRSTRSDVPGTGRGGCHDPPAIDSTSARWSRERGLRRPTPPERRSRRDPGPWPRAAPFLPATEHRVPANADEPCSGPARGGRRGTSALRGRPWRLPPGCGGGPTAGSPSTVFGGAHGVPERPPLSGRARRRCVTPSRASPEHRRETVARCPMVRAFGAR